MAISPQWRKAIYDVIVSFVLASAMAYVAGLVAHDASVVTASGLLKVVYTMNSAGFILASVLFVWSPGMIFMLGMGADFFIPALAFLFWMGAFYFMIRLDPLRKVAAQAQISLSYVLPCFIAFMLTIPLIIFHGPQNQVQSCLENPPRIGSGVCFGYAFSQDKFLKSTRFGDFTDFCMELSDERIPALANDLNNIPKDASYKEYCVYELFQSMRGGGGSFGSNVEKDFEKNVLPKEFAILANDEGLSFGERDVLLKTAEKAAGMSFGEAASKAICEEFGRRTDEIKKNRCLNYTEHSLHPSADDIEAEQTAALDVISKAGNNEEWVNQMRNSERENVSAVGSDGAVLNKTESDRCLSIQDGKERDFCIASYAIENSDQTICYDIPYESTQQYCLANIAMKEYQRSLCQQNEGDFMEGLGFDPAVCARPFQASDPEKSSTRKISVEIKNGTTTENILIVRDGTEPGSGPMGQYSIFFDGKIIDNQLVRANMPGSSMHEVTLYGNNRNLTPGVYEVTLRVDSFSEPRSAVDFSRVEMRYKNK